MNIDSVHGRHVDPAGPNGLLDLLQNQFSGIRFVSFSTSAYTSIS